MPDILTIAGSPSENSRSGAILAYAQAILEERLLSTEIVTVRDLPAKDLLLANWDNPTIQASLAQVVEAPAIIIATPVYKASYSGILKSYLDLLPQNVLKDKIVLPIATGGSPGHLLSIDYALKPVLSALGAQHILQGIYATDSQIERGETYRFAPELKERLDKAISTLADLLLVQKSIRLEKV